MKIFIYLSIFIMMLMNLGKFFDVSEVAKKADIIVCLGGGNGERTTKVLELYLYGYSKSDKIILTGSTGLNKKENKVSYLARHGVPKENIIFLKGTSNTMNEMLLLKAYMLEHGMKSVMFISDPPHSRRIMFLANTIVQYKDYGLSSFVVGSDVAWWNREDYYENNKAVRFVMSEMLKLPFNYITYAIVKPLGLYNPIKENAGGFLNSIKYHIQKFLF